MRSFTLLLAAAFTAAANGQERDIKPEMKQLQGTWRVVSLEDGGEKAVEAVTRQMKLVFEGEKCTFFAGETVLMQGAAKLDPDARPKSLDLASTAGRLKGQSVACIYELDGESLKICLGRPGGPRPTEFKSGKDQPLVALKRGKR